MKYSPSLEIILSLALSEAQAGEFAEIEPEHLLMALLKFAEFNPEKVPHILMSGVTPDFLRAEIRELKKELRARGLTDKSWRRELRQVMGKGGHLPQGVPLHRARATKKYFLLAELKAKKAQAPQVAPHHLLAPILDHPTALIAYLLHVGKEEPGKQAAPEPPPITSKSGPQGPTMAAPAELTQILKELRQRLLQKIIGQDHAVYTFVEGLFNAEVLAAVDTERQRPKAIFVFAGPPGVGKTYLAETGAQALARPFKRFDMSGYSDRDISVALLAGAQRSYQAAKPGLLTEFVAQNPEAILLFDEIEKAHLNVIHLFLQILDNASLEDKFTETKVSFKDTIIIFTTNAGKALYDNANTFGVQQAARVSFHRQTILNALENEIDPRTRQPFFPQAICSRMATGYPLMFNHLGIAELERIAAMELQRQGEMLQKKFGPQVEFGSSVPLCLVLREGAHTDARTVRSQSELFVKSELFKFFSLYQAERLTAILAGAAKISFDLDAGESLSADLQSLLQPALRPKILLALRPGLEKFGVDAFQDFDGKVATDLPEAQNLLDMYEFDLVLLDLWLGSPDPSPGSPSQDLRTAQIFDRLPPAARNIHLGQELLRLLHTRFPQLPCYLLALKEPGEAEAKLDEELFLACVRSGGARGLVTASREELLNPSLNSEPSWANQLQAIAAGIGREKQAGELWSQNKALSFDSAPWVGPDQKEILIRLRNLRTTQATAAADVGAMLQEVERPTTCFTDVFGADQAKVELRYIVNWLKNPKHFQTLGLKPPRGILLYGPPGTGKTMLARALAGECKATFITESAANFITKYIGSGPESVRTLFARARRYAPSIIFIDEIDTIGRKRTAEGHHRYHEETLNSLLTEMDGFGTPGAKPVVVLAATNLVESLDAALRRRFDRDIEVDKPDRAARMAFLKLRLQGSATRQVSDQVLERLSGQSANMTIAELERIIQLAGRQAALRDGIITDALLEEAFETMRLGAPPGGRTDPETLLRIARHEAGHCLIGWRQGYKPVQITIVARGKAGGFVERESQENRQIYTKAELEGRIRQCMGGRAAEILFYGPEGGLSSGVGSDLQQATHFAELMVRDFGMSPEIGQVALTEKRPQDGPLALAVNQAVSSIIQNQLQRAVDELAAQRPLLDRLVGQLLEKNRLVREELEEIFNC